MRHNFNFMELVLLFFDCFMFLLTVGDSNK
jgi:hypothetical protein